MMSVTQSNEEEKKKFGELILEMATKRANSPDGAVDLKGFSKDQFLDVLGRMTKEIDGLPEHYSIHSLYLALNYIGKVVVGTMEANRKRMATVEGNA